MKLPIRVHDLSQPVFNDCPQYADVNPRPALVNLLYMQPVQGVNKELIRISTHTGTHCDAPYHFFNDGETIDAIPLETYVAPATILDLRHKEPGTEITVEDVERSSAQIQRGDVALLNTGWGHKRANTKEFLTQYVYLGGPAAARLVERGVKGVGIDAVSLGGYNDWKKAAPAHQAMLGNAKFICEELFFPHEVMDGKRRLFCAFPIKLRGCGGAWSRAVLLEFDS
ncbi:MAG: cyclase family protein [Candidatus Eremiobacteraeota bacterium]|nr:cyclase family protein [Candidatus Eremiobacteraeota bacterium]